MICYWPQFSWLETLTHPCQLVGLITISGDNGILIEHYYAPNVANADKCSQNSACVMMPMQRPLKILYYNCSCEPQFKTIILPKTCVYLDYQWDWWNQFR
jgi:hypothetical protein